MMNYLKALFTRCLNARYITTAEDGNYAIELDGRTLYLLFEHSNGIEDWKNNFDFPVSPYKNMNPVWQCHRGFLRVWRGMQEELEERVAYILARNQRINSIVCVGYSHGGALAVFATEDMEYLHGARCNVSGYGFGAPRVLFGIVPREIKHRLRNFITVRNIPDLVTHLPPLVFGFQNAGTLKRIGKRGKYTPVSAHFSESYLAELEALEEETKSNAEQPHHVTASSVSYV